MSVMIPSTISPEIKSNAERKIFEWFKEAPNTDSWIVLHSLGVSNHKTLVFGEIDFLILAPNLGYFALEVKGGRVSRKDGEWIFTDRFGNTGHKQRGPFDQAREGIFSIIELLKKKADGKHQNPGNILFGYGVMFPDIEYFPNGIDEEQFQVFDFSNNRNVKNYIQTLSTGFIKKLRNKYGPNFTINVPSREDVNYAKNILRGDFDYLEPLMVRLKMADTQMIKLTKEQYMCIDQLEDNPRCLIQGSAGTGKTLLALEAAKRYIAKGESVALFCYNKNLGEYLEYYFDIQALELKPAYVGTFHKFIKQYLENNNCDIQDFEHSDNFFNETLPNLYINKMIFNDPLFDRIIIDEAQDLVTPINLDVFDLSLKKGLERGRWIMFGDFTMQAIYSSFANGDTIKRFVTDAYSCIQFKLTINCRNTKPIVEEVATIIESTENTFSSLIIEGPPVNYYTYLTVQEQLEKLTQILQELIKNGVPKRDITILSPVRRNNSVVNDLKKVAIQDYQIISSDEITFCTIQSFKGLENNVIILTDINTFQDTKLMYVAMSRAKLNLIILESGSAVKEYKELFKRRLTKYV